jgi:hypothetical protein
MFTVLQRHVSTHTSHHQARTRRVHKVTVLILGSQTLTCFYIDVIYCIIIGGCNKCHCYSIILITLDVFSVCMDRGFGLVCYVRWLD